MWVGGAFGLFYYITSRPVGLSIWKLSLSRVNREIVCKVGNSQPVGAGFKGNSDCIQNGLIGEMCTVPNIGVEIESSAEQGSEIESVNILCTASHTVGATFYEDLDCDQNCFISKTCVAPGVGVNKESSSERGSEVVSGGIIVLKEGAEVRILDIQGAGILPSVGLTSVKMSNWSSPLNIERELEIHKLVVQYGLPNLRGCRIPMYSGLNITKWRTQFERYRDSELVDFLEFGWGMWVESDRFQLWSIVRKTLIILLK